MYDDTMVELFLIELIILLYILTQTISTSKKIIHILPSLMAASHLLDARLIAGYLSR